MLYGWPALTASAEKHSAGGQTLELKTSPIQRCQQVIQRRNKVLDFLLRLTMAQQDPDRCCVSNSTISLARTLQRHGSLAISSSVTEEQLDAELDKLDQMDEDEMERLKEKHLEALKKSQQQKQEWLSKGHGEYREIPSEREFFTEVKESKNVICHFYKDSTFRCKILDKHLAVLAKKHFETKFLKLNVEKAKQQKKQY
ncbi:unnamed protein product [Ranitomeya imitator]|uniref:Thioredoxin domain-containing protein n=1 Tax=Ranitomeya imitator TaxID=111125 RepID=A0ABN9MPU3_9NEOB|nr:unnamed protein product [Ranitomeya imitator]